MRLPVLLALLLLLTGFAVAVDNQAFLGIFAETSANKMAGMPDLSAMMGGMDPAMMANNPAMAMMMPRRGLTVRLWSPGIAPKDAFASLAIPDGLKLGPKLDLALYRPEPGKVEGGDINPDSIKDFTIKLYWGSSPTVKAGQPIVYTWKDFTPEQKEAMRQDLRNASKNSSYYYKPDWTTGYWPTGKKPTMIDKQAALVGTYTLTTNYTGNVALDVPAGVNFLAPLELTAPKLDKPPALDKAVTFNWKPVPTVLGYHMMVMGMQGKNTLIMWLSSEKQPGMDIEWSYMQMAEVRRLVAAEVVMGPERKDVTMPAGIFTGCDFVNMMMIGYGPGAALAEGQPLPRCQTKTTLMVMLGGKEVEKMMKDMGGMGGGDAGDDGE